MTWLITVAMELEARLLIARLAPAPSLGGRPCHVGVLPGPAAGRRVLLLLTGMGQVNAAQATTAALERLDEVEAVINLGCAGAYPGSGLAVGQAAAATEAVHADLGVLTARRWHPLDLTGIPLLRGPQGLPVFNRLPVDQTLTDALCAARPGLPRGAFATVNQVSGDQATALALETRWGALLEDMETAAVAQVAALYAKPFAALRGASNIAGQRELDVAAGAEAAQKVLLGEVV
jgi:futalosine hydrolase